MDTTGTQPEPDGGAGGSSSRRIRRFANSRRQIRRKTVTSSQVDDTTTDSSSTEESTTPTTTTTMLPTSPETPATPTSPETPATPTSPETPATPTSPETPATPTSPETPRAHPADDFQRSGSDVSTDTSSCQSDEGINDAVTNLSGLTTSVYSFFGQAATTTWGWMKTAVNTGVSLWYGDATSPEEWHCDSDGDDDETGHDRQAGEGSGEEDISSKAVVRDKRYFICNELRSTEEAYVDRLGILVMVREQASKMLNPDVIRDIFQNVEVIHQFHRDNLLPQLQQRLDQWDDYPRIGDIMRKLVPFLKLYTEYVKNFERASQVVDTWEAKSSAFADLLKEVRTSTTYGRLRIQAHMLEPVQRVPRYELLLRDYLRKLPEDSPDRPDTEQALQLVSGTASHFESMMKRDTRISELMKIQRELDGPVNVVGSKRALVKRGKVMKVSARSGKTSDKYAFLFNDLLLLCNEQTLPGLSSGHYKVRHIFELESARLTPANNLDVANTFYIKSTKHVVELACRNSAEVEEWMGCIGTQLATCTKEKLKRQADAQDTDHPRTNSFGQEAPVYVRMNDVTMCMLCGGAFSTLKRKQHCKACGQVVCSRCSSEQLKLDYDSGGRAQKVCDDCYRIAQDGTRRSSQRKHYKGQAEGVSMEKAFLQLSSDSGKTWKGRYFSIHDSHMLYSFKAVQDTYPLTSLSLRGCRSSVTEHDSKPVLEIKVAGRRYLLADEQEEVLHRWQRTLESMTSSSRYSIASDDSISLDSQSIDSQSLGSVSLDSQSSQT